MTYVLVHSKRNLKPAHIVVVKITKIKTDAVFHNRGYLLLIYGGFLQQGTGLWVASFFIFAIPNMFGNWHNVYTSSVCNSTQRPLTDIRVVELISSINNVSDPQR